MGTCKGATLFAIDKEAKELITKMVDCGKYCYYGGPPAEGEVPILCDTDNKEYEGDAINRRIGEIKESRKNSDYK